MSEQLEALARHLLREVCGREPTTSEVVVALRVLREGLMGAQEILVYQVEDHAHARTVEIRLHRSIRSIMERPTRRGP